MSSFDASIFLDLQNKLKIPSAPRLYQAVLSLYEAKILELVSKIDSASMDVYVDANVELSHMLKHNDNGEFYLQPGLVIKVSELMNPKQEKNPNYYESENYIIDLDRTDSNNLPLVYLKDKKTWKRNQEDLTVQIDNGTAYLLNNHEIILNGIVINPYNNSALDNDEQQTSREVVVSSVDKNKHVYVLDAKDSYKIVIKDYGKITIKLASDLKINNSKVLITIQNEPFEIVNGEIIKL